MDEKHTYPSKTSFFQDTQKLTFALGLTSGLAVMAIAGLIIVSVQGGNRVASADRGGGGDNTVADTTGTDTGAANSGDTVTPNYDPLAVAKAIGLNEDKFTSCLNSKKYTSRIDRDLNEGNTAGVNGTPTSFVNNTAVSGALPYAQVKSAIDAALAGTKGTVAVPEVKKDDHVRGAKNPKVYLVEYSDFQCPFCKQFHPSLQQALTEYKDQVAVVYRHFPLESIHPLARPLAEGSECAAEIGGEDAFWEYHDKVFES
jgi:protein-disulfide isomerase